MTTPYIKVPMSLLKSKTFQSLKSNHMIAYGLISNRIELSKVNGIMENDIPYVWFTQAEMAESLHCSLRTASGVMRDLRAVHLISYEQIGKGACRIFLGDAMPLPSDPITAKRSTKIKYLLPKSYFTAQASKAKSAYQFDLYPRLALFRAQDGKQNLPTSVLDSKNLSPDTPVALPQADSPVSAPIVNNTHISESSNEQVQNGNTYTVFDFKGMKIQENSDSNRLLVENYMQSSSVRGLPSGLADELKSLIGHNYKMLHQVIDLIYTTKSTAVSRYKVDLSNPIQPKYPITSEDSCIETNTIMQDQLRDKVIFCVRECFSGFQQYGRKIRKPEAFIRKTLGNFFDYALAESAYSRNVEYSNNYNKQYA